MALGASLHSNKRSCGLRIRPYRKVLFESFGRVRHVVHQHTGVGYALKCLRKAKVVASRQTAHVLSEAALMATVHHLLTFLRVLLPSYVLSEVALMATVHTTRWSCTCTCRISYAPILLPSHLAACTQVHHPLVVRLVARYQDAAELYLLQEMAYGGELYSLLRRRAPLPEVGPHT